MVFINHSKDRTDFFKVLATEDKFSATPRSLHLNMLENILIFFILKSMQSLRKDLQNLNNLNELFIHSPHK